ncbi:HEAT repeat domain-containing protein [Krasilnikovia sp. MM14-A1259]|uniref:HEAT repeat domain-containing protein n=1 Tax=Krasilnikovia sp. MM14-A1259 TaxID=3373539 RepID=UPI0038200255
MEQASEKELHDALSRLGVTGADSDTQLRQLYDSSADTQKNRLVVALGDTPKGHGLSLLQDIASDRNAPTDRRCAAVVALAKQLGVESSPLLRECLRDDEPVRNYAIQGLAAVGDDGAWPEVLELLTAEISVQAPIPPFALQWETLSLQSTVLPAICYLGRHLTVAGRRERVTQMVRDNWSRLYTAEQRWFDQFWPECNPGNPERNSGYPDPKALAEWAGGPLLKIARPER